MINIFTDFVMWNDIRSSLIMINLIFYLKIIIYELSNIDFYFLGVDFLATIPSEEIREK